MSNGKDKGVTPEQRDPEDVEALSRATGESIGGAANQGAATPSPGAGATKEALAPTPGAQMFSDILADLFDEFFVRKFGGNSSLSERFKTGLKADIALAIDTYIPNVQTRPGVTALIILGSHYALCARQAAIEKRLASSDKAAQGKPLSSSSLSPESTG